jgi:CRISPR-associated protein Cas1
MIKRTLYFGNPVYLCLKQEQMLIDFKSSDKENKTIPIEDIGLIVIDNQQVTITHGLTNALLEKNSALLWCDSRHMPNGLILPLSGHHIFTEKLQYQLSASEPLKKQLWKQTVQNKIMNQAVLLRGLGFETQNMLHWATQTGSGDPKNMEGRAAAWYWKCIFEAIDKKNTTRYRYGEPPNHMFNYGYAILRAIVARSLVASGCLPAIGIHHRNKYNPFCLADDIMEPYRPYVDKLVLEWVMKQQSAEIPEILNPEMKAHLLQIPVIDISIKGMKSPLMVGMQRTTASLMDCFEGLIKKINYPEM